MPILLTRIDDRLIHGQVVVGWAQALKADHIVVINDECVNNDMQKFLFRMATPSDINLTLVSVAEAAERIKKREFDNENTILIAKSPADIRKMVELGGKIGEVNIGGMHFSPEKTQLFDAIFVNMKDVEDIIAIKKAGIGLEVRMVPTDARKDPLKAIDEKIYKKKGKQETDGA